MERKSFSVTEPTFSRFGSPDPLGTLAAFKINLAAGGVFVINVKLRSAYTVISTGIKSLKVGFNRIYGYYIEVSKSNLEKIPEKFLCGIKKNNEKLTPAHNMKIVIMMFT